MVLARILDPSDFGLVAMVTTLTGMLSLFRDFGLSTATIQRQSISDEQLSTLFWVNVLIGALLSALTLASAHLIANFYREPRLVWITTALAASFLFNAAGIQHSALLAREMRFATLAAIEVIALAMSVSAGIGIAYAGFGYWALVAMTLTAPLVYSVCVWICAAWIPGLPRRQAGVGSLIRMGSIVTLNGIVVYVAYNLEKILLGRFWGPDALGIYGRAYQLVSIPTENLNSAVGEVAFSALSRVQGDVVRLKRYFLAGYSLVVAVTLPITTACALFASDLILVLLGPKWTDAVPLFRILAPTILVLAMINPLSWLLVSQGLVKRSLRIALVLAPLVMTSYIIGLPYGPTGVAIAYSTVMVLWVIPHLAWCVHGTAVSLKDIAQALSRPVLSIIMASALAGVIVLIGQDLLPPLGRLLVGVTVLLVSYVGILFRAMGQAEFYMGIVRGANKPSMPDRVG